MPTQITRYIKIAGIVVVVLSILWILFVLKSWKEAYDSVPKLKKELSDVRIEYNNYKNNMEKEYSRILQITQGYVDEIKYLKATASAQPSRVVRLCPEPAKISQSGSRHAPATGTDAAAPGTGQLPETARPDNRPGPDIGPDLYALADEADMIVAQCRALQDYVKSLPIN